MPVILPFEQVFKAAAPRFMAAVETRGQGVVARAPSLGVDALARGGLELSPTVRRIGPNLFEAGVPTLALEVAAAPATAGRQRMSNWCWAATSQQALNVRGVPVQQEELVARLFGGLINRTADESQILASLNTTARLADGRVALVQATKAVNEAEVIAELAARQPLIAGLRVDAAGGHAHVMTGAKFSLDPAGNPIIHSATVRDPWPNNPSRKELSWGEVKAKLMTLIKVRVTPLG